MHREYLTNAIDFLKEVDWIYNYPNTDILTKKILDDHFQPEWLPHLKNITNDQLNRIPCGFIDTKWPASLRQLLERIGTLRKCEIVAMRETERDSLELPKNIRIGTKKRHEIASLLPLVQNECEKSKAGFVIDVGAGLGHLSHLLHLKCDRLKVLAIEGDHNNHRLAFKNQQELYPSSQGRVVHVRHFIGNDSAPFIKRALEEAFPEWNQDSDSVCVTGLHACADLSVTVLRLFAQMGFAKALVVLPCCYHRLELAVREVVEGEAFVNFPASGVLREVYGRRGGEAFLRTPFLRLAGQRSVGSWSRSSEEAHRSHSEACMFRAILQEVAEEANLRVRRLKRKTGKRAADGFEDYVGNLGHAHEFVSMDASISSVVDHDWLTSRMLQKWEERKDDCYLIEILSALQTAVQNICENVVLFDRIELLLELGAAEAEVFKMADDCVSPRCHALVARKSDVLRPELMPTTVPVRTEVN